MARRRRDSDEGSPDAEGTMTGGGEGGPSSDSDEVGSNVWSKEQYWLKAVSYVHRAHESERESSDFPFWSALALEFLARAALTAVHPALNADPQDDGNSLLHAFGFRGRAQPKTIPIHAVYGRLERMYPAFGKPERKICDYMAHLRNQELHSADSPLEGLSEEKWLASFYRAAQALCGLLNHDLSNFLGAEIARRAIRMVEAAKRAQESEVKSRIAAHMRVFRGRSADDRAKATARAEIAFFPWSRRHACPACESPAVLRGELMNRSRPRVDDDGDVVVQITYLAVGLKCAACELELEGPEALHIAGVPPRFSVMSEFDLHEMHEGDEEREYDNM